MVVNSLLRRIALRSKITDAAFTAFAAPPALKDGMSVSVHDDGLVALDPKSGVVFSANRIGALIWTQLEQRISLDAIASEISRAYRIDRAVAVEDICRFLTDLQRRGLLQVAATR
jgi:hypothetical protein